MHGTWNRAKIFGDAPRQRLDRNAKARILAAARAYNTRHKTKGQHWGPLTRTSMSVLHALTHGFHREGDGRVFPSYEAIALAARCCRDSVCEAIKVLELAGLITWVHRLLRVSVRERDASGQWVRRTEVARTSNGYQLIDPLERQPGGAPKSENPPGPLKQDSKSLKAVPAAAEIDPTTPLARALAGFGRALGALP